MTDFVLILKYLRRFHIIQNASHMHLVKSNFIRGNVLKKKYFQTPNLYIYSTSRDRNHKGTYNALQFNSRLWRIKSRCQNTGEIRYSVKKFIPFQLDILIIGNTSNYNLVILDFFHQREHPTPPPPPPFLHHVLNSFVIVNCALKPFWKITNASRCIVYLGRRIPLHSEAERTSINAASP